MLWGGHNRVRDFLAIGAVLLVGAARRLLRLNGRLAGGAAGDCGRSWRFPDNSRFHGLNGNSNSRFGDRQIRVKVLICRRILGRYGANRRNFPGYFPVTREFRSSNRAQREFRRCGAARSPAPSRPAVPRHQVSAVPLSPTPPFLSITPNSCNRHGQAGLQPSPLPPNRSAPSRGP
jgi:hypothetical protein